MTGDISVEKDEVEARVLGAVLAAGLGTRLRPLTLHVPKPLVPVAGLPLLEYAFNHLNELGVQKIGVNAHHLGQHLVDRFEHRSEEIFVVEEDELQGTGGGIRDIAARYPDRTVVAINGDALFDFHLEPLLRRHWARGALGTLVLRYVPMGAPFGKVAMDGSGRLKRVAELTAPGADAMTLFYGAYTGVMILEPELIQKIPGGPCDILRSAYKSVLDENGPIFGDFVAPDCLWVDCGTPERYLAAHRFVLDGKISPKNLPPLQGAGVRVDPTADVHDSAVLHGPCVILAGAQIAQASRRQHCISMSSCEAEL